MWSHPSSFFESSLPPPLHGQHRLQGWGGKRAVAPSLGLHPGPGMSNLHKCWPSLPLGPCFMVTWHMAECHSFQITGLTGDTLERIRLPLCQDPGKQSLPGSKSSVTLGAPIVVGPELACSWVRDSYFASRWAVTPLYLVGGPVLSVPHVGLW